MAMTAIPSSLEFGIKGSIEEARVESQIARASCLDSDLNIPFTFWHLRYKLLPSSSLVQAGNEQGSFLGKRNLQKKPCALLIFNLIFGGW
jgi:hypothetical protein